jgi:hypothetical protein
MKKKVTLALKEKIANRVQFMSLLIYSYEIVQFYNCTICSDMFHKAVLLLHADVQGDKCSVPQQLLLHSCQMSRDTSHFSEPVYC